MTTYRMVLNGVTSRLLAPLIALIEQTQEHIHIDLETTQSSTNLTSPRRQDGSKKRYGSQFNMQKLLDDLLEQHGNKISLVQAELAFTSNNRSKASARTYLNSLVRKNYLGKDIEGSYYKRNLMTETPKKAFNTKNGGYALIREFLCENPKLSTKEIMRKLKLRGVLCSKAAVSTTRSAFLSAQRAINKLKPVVADS